MAEDNQPAAADETPSQQFALQRIFIKDVSFETPQGVDAFRRQWQPKINLELNTRHQKLDDNNYEVVLTVGVTAKQDDQTAFLVEVQQAGVFHVSGFEANQTTQILGTACPNVLFPYARETIDSLVIRGSFPPVMLAPVNFDALFQEAVRQAAERQQAQGGEAAPAAGEAGSH